MKAREITTLEGALGHRFGNVELLKQALTHSSHARELEASKPQETTRAPDNEQLEFLGDAVLGFVTTEHLFRTFPDYREGDLSKLRAHLVSERHLIRVALQLEIGHYLHLGRGEEKSGGRSKTALLVDALEAIIGAICLDDGLETARHFVLQHVVAPELEVLARTESRLPVADYKSALQEKLQAVGRPQPVYVLVKQHGPEHSKTFTVEARMQALVNRGKSEFVARAEGSTKKYAEQEAARQVLEYLASVTEGRSLPQ
ncbi:MAG: Ribonuclease 3 [Acidobacteriaceae bacterium]|jgi:ribonuclease-3|nr:Ribonuclease 3 [Acidobacteriaceae bacterium]